jgi:hypothetical protein
MEDEGEGNEDTVTTEDSCCYIPNLSRVLVMRLVSTLLTNRVITLQPKRDSPKHDY